MLDHINWYLVELERHLRRRRSAQATADMLVETRAHLHEHASELIARGMDPVTAAKAAVADFGSPSSVLQAYSGAAGMSVRTYRALIALAAALLSSLVVAVYVFIFSPLSMQSAVIWLTTIPWLSIPIVLWVGFRVKRWIALPIAAVSLAFSLAAGLWATSKAEIVMLGGESRMIYMPSVERQIKLRNEWLARAKTDLDLIQEWRAQGELGLSESGQMLQKFAAVPGYGFVAPYPYYGGQRFRVLPSDYPKPKERLVMYSDDRLQGEFTLGPSPNLNEAAETWKANGDKYIAYLKRRSLLAAQEAQALMSIQPQPWSEKVGTITATPLLMVGTASLILLCGNGLAILAAGLLATSRRQRWRRQLG